MALFNPNYRIVLGSSSPRRQEMLQQMGLDFDICKPETEERRKEGESPSDYVLRNCQEKAQWVMKQQGDASVLVIAADTIVVQGDRVLEKPLSEVDAKDMLRCLSGQSHEVMSAFSVILRRNDKLIVKSHLERTTVHFAELSESDISFYVQTGEPMDKAGSYGIQGIGGFMVKRIEGSYSNVVGLPMHQLLEVMKSLN